MTCDRRDEIVPSLPIILLLSSIFSLLQPALATSTFVRIFMAMQKTHMLVSKPRCISIELDLRQVEVGKGDSAESIEVV